MPSSHSRWTNNWGGVSGDRKSLDGGHSRRSPCILCLDVSGSMEGEPLAELNAGLRQFYREVWAAMEVRGAYDFGIVTFGDDPKVVRPLAPLTSPTAPTLELDGGTHLGAALQLTTRIILERRAQPLGADAAGFRPWVVLMSDGQPFDEWKAPAKILRAYAMAQKIVVLAIGVGEHADMEMLGSVTAPYLGPIRMRGLNFSDFFGWLRQALALAAGSKPGGQLVLPPRGSWEGGGR